MQWKDIQNTVAKAAPLLGSLILGPAGGAVGTIISGALGVEDTPDAVYEALSKDPEALAKLKMAEENHRHDLEAMKLKHDMHVFSEVNKTIREELKTQDKFKSYWRPMFGYVGAFTWVVQTIAVVTVLVYASIFETDVSKSATLLDGVTNIVTALTTMWGILLSVLGLNIHQRSKDKQTANGVQSKGLLAGLLK